MVKKQKNLTISQLAKLAAVNLQTIYYYEDLGLLPEPARTASGYRTYEPEYIENIYFIKQAQELGFKLEEIRALVDLRFNRKALGQDVKDLVRKKIVSIDAEIKKLTDAKVALQALDRSCAGDMPATACPIINSMKSQGCH